MSSLLTKKRLILTFTTGLAMLMSTVSINHGTTVAAVAIESTPIVEAASITQIPTEVTAQPIASVEQYVNTYFADTPILAKVAKCESRFRQYDSKGNPMRGMVREDVGVMQINEYYHKDTADKLGLDIHTLDGNIAYAKYLYDKEGTAPWSASQSCWSKI